MSDTPLVSFLMAAFNEERFVVACVASCLDQTYTPVEVCVTDDGSTDGTWDILQAAFGQDPRGRADADRAELCVLGAQRAQAWGPRTEQKKDARMCQKKSQHFEIFEN